MTAPKIDQRVIADAQLVAMFFRELRGQSTSEAVAIELAKEYVRTTILARISTAKPREPWEGDGT